MFLASMPRASIGASTPSKPAKTKSDYAWYLQVGHRDPKWNQHIEPGFFAFDSGNLATASIFLKKAYDAGCRDGLLLYRMGISLEASRRYAEAAELLALAAEEIPRRYPSHPLAQAIHEHAGRALYQVDDYARALPELEKAVQVSPDNFMVLLMAGQLMRLAGRTAEARAMFERALTAKAPAGMETEATHRLYRELVILTCDIRDLDACANYLEGLLALAPGDPVALSYRERLGREKALRKEREVIEKMVR